MCSEMTHYHGITLSLFLCTASTVRRCQRNSGSYYPDVTLTCADPSDVITIDHAHWGRLDGVTCVVPGQPMQSTNCVSGSIMNTVRQWCEGENSCIIQPTTEALGNPCSYTYKYLDVTYSCAGNFFRDKEQWFIFL